MKNVFKKLAFTALVAGMSLNFTGCAAINNIGLGNENSVPKYSDILQNSSQEKSYKKIMSDILTKNDISEQEMFQALMSNYYENTLETNNKNKQLENERILNLYTKKYEISNPLIKQKELEEIIKACVKDGFENQIAYNKFDEHVLDKVYGLSTFKLTRNLVMDYSNINVSQLEEEYVNHIKIGDSRPVFNIFETKKMLSSIKQSGSEEFFENQRLKIEMKYKRASSQEAVILKELEYTLNVFEKFYTNMRFNSIKKQNYEKEIKAIYNQNKNDVLKANNYNHNIGNQISF